MTAKDIKNMALACGACKLIEEANTIAELVALMGTPQGREFCKVNSFPSIDILREHKEELATLNVFVDAGKIELTDVDNAIIAGETTAVIRTKSVDKPYHAMVMHGAKAKVIAYGYSVCQVVNIGGKVECNKSTNASIFIM